MNKSTAVVSCLWILLFSVILLILWIQNNFDGPPDQYQSYYNDDSGAAEMYFSVNRIRENNGLDPLVFSYRLTDQALDLLTDPDLKKAGFAEIDLDGKTVYCIILQRKGFYELSY